MKAILFDFGGTLDSNGTACKEIFRKIYKQCSLEIEQEKFDRAFYDADDNLPKKHNLQNLTFKQTFKLQIKDVLNNLKIGNELVADKILDVYLTETRKYFKQNVLVLAELKKNYKLAVISNFFGNLNSVLESEGLIKYFDVTADSSIIGSVKPDSKIFMHVLSEINMQAENSLMVGDSVKRDIMGANALNMKSALLWGDRFKQNTPPEDMKDTIILKNLAELPKKLKEVNF